MNNDKLAAVQLLKTARGQIDCIIKMFEDDRYCIDISNQVLAVSSLVKKANMLILKQHLETCVKDAINNGDSDEKVGEIINILSKLIK